MATNVQTAQAAAAAQFQASLAAMQNAGQNAAASAAAKTDRPQSQVWANIGVMVKGGGPDGEDTFVSLPYGVPIDTMEPSKVPTKAGPGRDLFMAKNALLAQIQKFAESLPPGGHQILNLQIQLQRVNSEEAAAQSDSENPLLKAIMGVTAMPE